MASVYLYCALIGGAILVVQTVLMVLGIGADLDVADAPDAEPAPGDAADLSGDEATSIFLQVLTFKSVVAFLTFFGLTGMAAGSADITPRNTLFLSLGTGTVALFGVAHLMNLMSRLHSSGNVDLSNAVGNVGSVYLRVPAQNAGHGKIHVTVQGRTAEVKAQTAGPELPTGSPARVVRMIGSDIFEVVPAEES